MRHFLVDFRIFCLFKYAITFAFNAMPLYEGLSSLSLINEKNTTVVFDFGHAYTKLGFADEISPRAIVKSHVLCRKTKKLVPVFDYKDDNELRHHLIDFIHKLYFKHLLVNPKDRRVLVTENILGPSLFKNMLASVLFRHFEVFSILFVPSHLVTLLTLGVKSGVVIDMGWKEVTVLPVYEGVPVLKAWQALPLGSCSIHQSLSDLLFERSSCMTKDGKDQRLSNAVTDLPTSVLEDISVRCCFVSNFERKDQLQKNKYDRSVEPPPPSPNIEYPYSDVILTVPGTVREMAAEHLFEMDRDQLNVPTMILDAIMKCSIDVRQTLASNLIITGGTANMTGMVHRILSEVRSLSSLPPYNEKCKIKSFKLHQPPAKNNYVVWLGGSIMGCTEATMLRSLTRESYLAAPNIPDWSSLAYNIKEEPVIG